MGSGAGAVERAPSAAKSGHQSGQDFLLRGRLFGEDGRAYSPWTSRVFGNRIYKHYVPQKDIALGGGASGLPRLQAYALEQQVMDHVHDHLKDTERVLDHLPDWMTQHPDGITVRLHVEGFVELIREFLQGGALPNMVRDIFHPATNTKPRKPKL